MEKLDKSVRNRLKKEAKKQAHIMGTKKPEQTSLILLPPPAAANEPDTDEHSPASQGEQSSLVEDEQAERVVILNKQEYNDILVKSWRNESKAAIHSLVYAEPEDAATVICSLLGKQ
jgi:hypothetical protein